MKTTILAAALLVLSGGTVAVAQFTAPAGGGIQTHVLAAMPQGEFARSLDDVAPGVALLVGGRIPGVPIVLGTELGFVHFGSESSLSLYDLQLGAGPGSGLPVEVVTSRSSHGIMMAHAVGRIQPARGTVRPFVDLVAGVKVLRTRSAVAGDFVLDFDDGFEGDNFDAAVAFSDVALSYGVGAGLDLGVYRGALGWDERDVTVALSAGVRYLFGTEAEYVAQGPIVTRSGGLQLTGVRSRTDLLLPQFGFKVNL